MSYTFPFKENVIELGGGNRPFFRPNLDIRKEENVDIVADFNEPLPINDNQYNGVFSHYCIEHISWRKVKGFLNEVYRILKPSSKAVFVTANTEIQMKWVLDHDEWNDNCSCIIFGDQDYSDNTHKNSLNPKYAIKLLSETGFENIIILPHGELGTDMIIEATKPEQNIEDLNSTERKSLFDKNYFNGGHKVGGYAREGYWDYPVHWVTFDKIMELNPKSVLEIGCARGYLVKRFESNGIKAKGLEISKHCYLTRVTNSVVEFDVCETPWPFKDKEFDVCFSVAVMEHIPEKLLPKIMDEIDRVSNRGIHGIDYGENDDGFDKTHCSLHDENWWLERMPKTQVPVDKETLEKGSLSLSIPSGDGKLKLNFGSFINMFHNGWINLDIHDLNQFAQVNQYKFLQFDARKKINIENEKIDLMYSSHMLEHLTRDEGILFLQECYRLLKKGGAFRILVPDLEKIINLYQNNKLQIFDEINNECESFSFQSGKLWTLLFNGHSIAYDFNGLKSIGEQVGFRVEKREFNQGHPQIIAETMDNLPELSLIVEMFKD